MFELNTENEVDDQFLDGIFEDGSLETGKIHSTGCDALCVGSNLKCSNEKNKCNYSSTYCDNRGHGDNLEKKRLVNTPLSGGKSKRVRRFPGPAGLLPDQGLSNSTPLKLDTLLASSGQNSLREELCSQGKSVPVLEDNPWKTFLSDLGEDKIILDTVNIASIKRKATSKCFVGRKVPFLAATLHHIDISSSDPCIILQDVTGQIHGTLHREVWELFAGELVVGSVLVIRNVGLLSTGISFRRHYLNITANNILSIYSATTDKMKKTMLHNFTTQDYIKTIEHWQTLNPSNVSGTPMILRSPNMINSAKAQINSNMSFSSSAKALKTSVDIIHDISNCNKKLEVNTTLLDHCVGYSSVLNKKECVENTKSFICSPNMRYTQVPELIKTNNISCNLTEESNKFTINEANCNQVSNDINIYCKFGKNTKPSNNKPLSDRSNNNINTKTVDLPSNLRQMTSQVVLSQSTQLTAEEQSLVDSVFDGINADALFSDDF